MGVSVPSLHRESTDSPIIIYYPFNVGNGKTHYIKKQMKDSSHSLTISVNEAFTPLNAIKKLRRLNPSQRNCAIFLNFTMLPPGVSLSSFLMYTYI